MLALPSTLIRMVIEAALSGLASTTFWTLVMAPKLMPETDWLAVAGYVGELSVVGVLQGNCGPAASFVNTG